MLALTRRVNESIIIDGNIRVMVIGIRQDGAVRLGIEAPKGVTIDREEIHRIRGGGEWQKRKSASDG